MTAAFLSQTAPPELLVHILSYAATPLDVLSFALTCRHMLDAWKTHDTGLRTAWKLLMRDIPAAEQALIAVCPRPSRTGLRPQPRFPV